MVLGRSNPSVLAPCCWPWPGRVGQDRAGQDRAELGSAGQCWAELGRAGQGWAELGRAGQSWAVPSSPGQPGAGAELGTAQCPVQALHPTSPVHCCVCLPRALLSLGAVCRAADLCRSVCQPELLQDAALPSPSPAACSPPSLAPGLLSCFVLPQVRLLARCDFSWQQWLRAGQR